LRKRKSKSTLSKRESRSIRKVDFPDGLAKYLEIKYPEKWRSFKEFATTYEKFSIGVIRFLEILMDGDEQDKKIFDLVPLDFLEDLGIVFEIEKKNGEKITIGTSETGKSWSYIKHEIKFDMPILKNSNPLPIPSEIEDEDERKSAEELIKHIENHPVVLRALELFGGKIVGYKPAGFEDG